MVGFRLVFANGIYPDRDHELVNLSSFAIELPT